MEKLMYIASLGRWISIGLLVLGIVLIVLCVWRLDIRKVYLIRSGKARRKTVSMMEEHNNLTGKLRDDLDLDYTTGSLKKDTKKSAKTAEQDKENEVPFIKGEHSGNTGAFKSAQPADMPEGQKQSVREAEIRSEAAETSVLTPAEQAPIEQTVELNKFISDQYADQINEAFTENSGGINAQEPRVPMTVLSQELIIHTNEIIEI